MSDDVKKAGVRPVVPVNQDTIEPRDRDLPVADEAAPDTYVQAEPKADPSGGPANALFRSNEADLLQEAARLRMQMKDPIVDTRFMALTDYSSLAEKFTKGSPEVHAGAVVLRAMMKDPNGYVRSLALWPYNSLTSKFAEGSFEVYKEAEALRALMRDPDREVRFSAVKAYNSLTSKFAENSPEVHAGAVALRGLMEDPNFTVSMDAASTYVSLVEKFAKSTPELGLEVDGVFKMYSKLRTQLNNVFKVKFFHLSRIGFFKTGFESSTWIDKLGLSERAAHSLRGFASQPHFIGFRDSVMTVLDSLANLTDDRRAVLSRVFEVTDPNKWKSVRNTVRTLRALTTLDSLPEEVSREFYASHRGLDGDTRARLRGDIDKALLTFLREKVGDAGLVGMLFQDEVSKDKDLAAQWRRVQAVRKYLSDKGLLSLFAQSASFMDEAGIEILGTLFENLVESPVVDGELRHQKRYDRMVEQLGFSPDFVEKWSKEWSRARESTGEAMDVEEARALVMDQAAAQLAAHVNSTAGKEGEFKSLPDRLRTLTDLLKRHEADEKEIGSLHEIMELNYQNIRETYGDLFANARTDIKNLRAGLTKGMRTPKRAEGTEISGLVDRLAFHGMIPAETCQRLNKFYGQDTNGEGQPLNKILWGQFKVANYKTDNEVVARRMLEVTRDEDGADHLLVERPYTAGGFARLRQFDEDIAEHARGLGIGRDRVHFLGRHDRRPVPGPLATGAMIYRDSALAEVNPALMKPFQMLPATMMPMISARMMLRVGT